MSLRHLQVLCGPSEFSTFYRSLLCHLYLFVLVVVLVVALFNDPLWKCSRSTRSYTALNKKTKTNLSHISTQKIRIKIFSKFILKTNEQINKNKIRTKQKREIIDRPAHLYCVVVFSIYLYFYIFSSRAKRSILVCRLQSMQPQHVFNACFCCCAFAVCTYTYVCVYIGVITADWLFVANFFGGQFSGILVSKNCIKQRGEEKRKNAKNVVDKNAVAIKFHWTHVQITWLHNWFATWYVHIFAGNFTFYALFVFIVYIHIYVYV